MHINRHLPNILSVFRIAVIPVMVALFYIDTAWAVWTNVVLFSLAGASDYFDGRLARASGKTSLLGKFLDSTSDKAIVGVVLMMLIATDRLEGLWVLPALVIFVREIVIAGLREFMALYNVIVPISKLGKWKLTVQMIFIGFLIAGEYGDALVPYALEIGQYGLVLAALLTVISAWDYLVAGLKKIREIDSQP